MRQPPENSDSGRLLRRCVEAEPVQDGGGARGRRHGRRYRRAASGCRRCRAGHARSRPLAAGRRARGRPPSTKSISVVGPPGASCSTRPSRVLARNGDRARFRRRSRRRSAGTAWSCRRRCGRRSRPGRCRAGGGRLVEKDPGAEPERNIIDVQHAGLVACLVLHCKRKAISLRIFGSSRTVLLKRARRLERRRWTGPSRIWLFQRPRKRLASLAVRPNVAWSKDAADTCS